MDTTTFPYGYRFNFTFPGDQTINGKQLKGKIPYEFKIKKGTGNSLTLEQAWTDDNTFTKKAGLDCSSNNQCNVSSDTQKLNVKVGHQKKTDISSITGSGKIKMEKDKEGYNQGLKFTIGDGDVTFTGGTGEVEKLEELETYEIAEDGGKYYLTKKTSPDDLIKSSLSLPEGCKLPGEASVECTLDETNFKKINFDGKESNKPTGTATLTISKANSTDFPFGYKFTFKTESTDAEIKSGIKIKAKIPTDFKIKKGAASGQSTSLSLEKAWDDTKLAEKVGLNCTNSDGCCSKTAGGSPSVKLNVKKGTDVKTDIESVSTTESGKIKVTKDQTGYNQGLKFTITGGDVTLTGGSGGTFTTLEELETYEITEDKGKYYLTRKTSKEDVLKTSLSIPEGCFTSLGTSCTLTSDNFKNINFEGKENFSPSGTATLTITKTSSTDFPLGYRFTFNTTSEATIKSGTTTIKANIPTDFKIKKSDSNPTTLTLEKAWSDGDYSFAKKVGLSCTGSGTDECCTKSGSEQLNIKKGNDKKDNITSFTSATGSSGKIKVEKDKEGYNQGLKFTITGGNISLTGGSGSGTFTTLDEYETYEIKEDGGKYYLTRKTEASETIGDLLGLKGAGCSLSTSSASCTLNTEQIKSINFEGKDTTGATMANGTATLTIAKAGTSDFPLGYKFTLQSDSSDITIKSNTTTVKAKIPTEFKIKKNTSGQSTTLSLEKAWTAESLGKKVGLSCTNGTNNECTKESGGSQLNIKKDSDKKEGITSFSAATGSSGKIKVEKDQEGYNYGLKFYIDGGDVNLTGGSETKKSDSKEDLSTLEEYETYEITEEGGKWYLARKHESIVFIKKQLGLDFCTEDTWSRYTTTGGSAGTGFNISFSCEAKNVEHLKKIKFNSKDANHNWPTGSINLLLEMKRQKANTGGGGGKYDELKVTISDNRGSGANTTSVCIPDGAGGKIDIKAGSGGSNTSGAEYKIKKTGSGASISLCLEKKSGGKSSGSC